MSGSDNNRDNHLDERLCVCGDASTLSCYRCTSIGLSGSGASACRIRVQHDSPILRCPTAPQNRLEWLRKRRYCLISTNVQMSDEVPDLRLRQSIGEIRWHGVGIALHQISPGRDNRLIQILRSR